MTGPSVRQLINRGFLSEYRLFAPVAPDLHGAHTTAGDYTKAELAALMDLTAIIGGAVSHYKQLRLGARAIALCVSIEMSRHVAEAFNAAGIRAAHVDGDTPKGTARRRWRTSARASSAC